MLSVVRPKQKKLFNFLANFYPGSWSNGGPLQLFITWMIFLPWAQLSLPHAMITLWPSNQLARHLALLTNEEVRSLRPISQSYILSDRIGRNPYKSKTPSRLVNTNPNLLAYKKKATKRKLLSLVGVL